MLRFISSSIKSLSFKVNSKFARQIVLNEPEFLSAAMDQKHDLPNSVYQNLLVIPVKLPVFPQNTLVTQIHPLLYQHIEQKKLKHLGAFLLKDEAQAVEIQPQQFKELFLQESIEETTLKDEQTKEISKVLETTMPVKEQMASILENFHQNIIYETPITSEYVEPSIYFASSSEDIIPTGTICRISFQKLQEKGQEQIYLILKGLHRVQFISKSQPPTMNNEDEQKKVSEGFRSFFGKKTDVKAPFLPAKEIEEESIENLQSFLSYIKSQPIRDPTLSVAQETNYKIKLSNLLGLYAKLRQKIPINVPELVTNPTDPGTIDTLCGFLCLTTYFTRAEIIKLFLTLQLQNRMILCTQYFERYSRELTEKWDTLESKVNLPVDPQAQKQKMREIYDLLKKQFQTAGTGTFVDKINRQIQGRNFPPQVLQIIQDELTQIAELQESHPDFNSKRIYLELLVSLPFGLKSKDDYTLKQAQQVFESTHYGLESVKSRILEFLAVSKLRGSPGGKTLLLQGPPGVGKTSIASTIAECLDRKFVRISLGGESDVAVIKGHRRTYMASYPGKIVQALKQVQTENPVILLDEIDKLGHSFRGSISDSLLEVLDPVQNVNFVDNYLEIPIDLSKVLFICSANLLDTLPPPLLDRMEIIELSGYTQEEKIQITTRHLVPRIIKETGLQPYLPENPLSEEVIKYLIQYYCRESGVRSLQRTLQRLFEKLVVRVVRAQQLQGDKPNLQITIDSLDDLVGLPPFEDVGKRAPLPGLGVGLAYNSYGGSIMYIEIVPTSHITITQAEEIKDINTSTSKGSLKVTGQLGQTIKESVSIAYTHAKYILHQYFNNHYLEEAPLHMHFPAGSIKKDGPSAGIAIASALVSMALGIPIKDQTAMTGEISLTGKVLRIGGLKEKLLAAKREGIVRIIIPEGNTGDWNELPDQLKDGIEIHIVEDFIEVVNILFDKNFPKPE